MQHDEDDDDEECTSLRNHEDSDQEPLLDKTRTTSGLPFKSESYGANLNQYFPHNGVKYFVTLLHN